MRKWKWKLLSRVWLLTTPWTIQSMDFSRPEYSLSFLQGIFPTSGLNPGFPHCRQILYKLSHKGKPKNTGVGSLSLLQGIFVTQESNWVLLHCRQSLYQLSHQGKPSEKRFPKLQKRQMRGSLVGQWLRLCLPKQGTWVWSLVGKLISHMQEGS